MKQKLIVFTIVVVVQIAVLVILHYGVNINFYDLPKLRNVFFSQKNKKKPSSTIGFETRAENTQNIGNLDENRGNHPRMDAKELGKKIFHHARLNKDFRPGKVMFTKSGPQSGKLTRKIVIGNRKQNKSVKMVKSKNRHFTRTQKSNRNNLLQKRKESTSSRISFKFTGFKRKELVKMVIPTVRSDKVTKSTFNRRNKMQKPMETTSRISSQPRFTSLINMEQKKLVKMTGKTVHDSLKNSNINSKSNKVRQPIKTKIHRQKALTKNITFTHIRLIPVTIVGPTTASHKYTKDLESYSNFTQELITTNSPIDNRAITRNTDFVDSKLKKFEETKAVQLEAVTKTQDSPIEEQKTVPATSNPQSRVLAKNFKNMEHGKSVIRVGEPVVKTQTFFNTKTQAVPVTKNQKASTTDTNLPNRKIGKSVKIVAAETEPVPVMTHGLLFSNFIKKAKRIRKVELLIMVLTAPSKFERRQGVRKTWWKDCHGKKEVACWFFTDRLDLMDQETRLEILKERKKHKDIIFMPVDAGIAFGFRFLFIIQWAMAIYDARYMIRMDDDIMLCVNHLLWDLPNFPPKNLHYGWLHCNEKDVVYIDEGVCMFSKDVIVKFLAQDPEKILCHPYGDQQIHIWEQEIGLNMAQLIRGDNSRIHHYPSASYDENIKTQTNFCERYIAVHGLYGNDMLDFWNRRGSESDRTFSKYSDDNLVQNCPYEPHVDWELFGGMYHKEPKLCSQHPTWDTGGFKVYPGRENSR